MKSKSAEVGAKQKLTVSKLASKRRFMSYAARLMDEHGEDAINIVMIGQDGRRIPIDLGDIDGMDNPCEIELTQDGELMMKTVIGEQFVEPRGVMRDPAMYAASKQAQIGSQILDSMMSHNHMSLASLKEERAQSMRYREDADKYRDEAMALRQENIDLKSKLANHEGEDSMAPIVDLAKTAFFAWQAKDFRQELIQRAKIALANGGFSDEEADLITRFINRPEFSAMGAIELAKPPAEH